MNNEKSSAETATSTQSPDGTDSSAAATKPRTTRSRRASAKVTSPAPVPPPAPVADTPAAEMPPAGATAADAPVKKAPVRRSRAKKADAALLDGTVPDGYLPDGAAAGTGTPATDLSAAAADSAVEPVKTPAKRAPRRRATAATGAPAPVQGVLNLDSASPITAPAASAEPASAEAVSADQAPVAKAPARRRSVKKVDAATDSAAAAPAEAVAEAAEQPGAEAPTRPARSRRKSTAAVTDAAAPSTSAPAALSPAAEAPAAETPVDAAAAAPDATVPADSPFLAPSAGISVLFQAPDLSLAVSAPAVDHDDADGGDDFDSHDESRSRRGRARNRRNKHSDAQGEAPAHAAGTDDADADTEGHDDGVTSRRRRRRRRGDADLELTGGTDEDPPNTVTRVRAPRTPAESSSSASNRVTSLRGSTRLEAKKQRRRDSRDSGRRRTVITEAEFLARRESVDRVMVVRQSDDRIQIGVLEDGILAEHFVSKTQQDSLIGNVYLGKVQNVLPSMEAAFVDIGRGRNAVLYAGEVDWDAANLNGQPRRIENALKSGDAVLVQVSKDPVGHKGARLTSQISLPGRYLVYVPGGSMTGISRKLPDVERNRLKRVLKDHLPENAGVIVRTAAEGASEEELTNDINRLRAQWEGISTRAAAHKTLAPEMLYAEPDLTIKVVRDVFNEDFTKLIVAGEEAWDTIEAYVTYVAPDLLDRLEKWTKTEDIFGAHRIDEQISKALERKVFLPSGGSLVIDRTEAMTVVDVNTGKFTGSGGNLEETVTKNNLEAAEEVVRQLRLRDIGGIIVIDFIDMVLESNRDLVLRRMVECLGRDRTKHQVAEVTSLGLVQMTRKRMGTGLLEVFGEQCEVCAGRGMVTHEIPVEHRRVHTVAAEQHHPHGGNRNEGRDGDRGANRSTRSERKRNRSRQTSIEDDAPATHEVEELTEAQRTEKANAARTALANIAAAAAAAHHEAARSEPARPEPAHHDVGEVEVQSLPTSLGETATLTLGGEAVELPRGHHTGHAVDPAHHADSAAALAGIAQALDQLSGQDGEDTPAGSRSRSRRSRRNRSASRAQGGAGIDVETGTGPVPAHGSAQHSSAAVRLPEPVQAPTKDAGPIILGVGVPASEL
ncbi:Rne/Rng family ribonuclease [Specibacter sp. RAF43]|uniref:Rne/Rng family ribonuclease n=1 Tax=Specibacter sp. RAF43 TaxID=3233057 RepID=UPI003F9667E9